MKRVTVEDIVGEAYRLLGDLENVVSSSRQIGYGSTHEQALALADVQHHLAGIKTALGRMDESTDKQTATLANIGHDLSDVQVALRRIQGALRQPR